jgi:hypothetical protein
MEKAKKEEMELENLGGGDEEVMLPATMLEKKPRRRTPRCNLGSGE